MKMGADSKSAHKKRGRGRNRENKADSGELDRSPPLSAPIRPDKSWIAEQCGEVAFRIFNALPLEEAEGETDFDLATALDLPLVKVRKGLYLLQDNGLVTRREHRSAPSSAPSFYTYRANWPRAPPAVPVKEPERAVAADVPDCYRWTV